MTPRSSFFRATDLLDESLATLADRPGRSILTALGTMIGAGMLVAVLGLAATTAAQVSGRFDALAATQVRVEDARDTVDADPDGPFPADADARLDALNGVTAAGVAWTPRGAQQSVSAAMGGRVRDTVSVTAASAGYLTAAGTTVAQGRLYDAFHDDTRQAVAVLGPAAASQLGIIDISTAPAVFIGGTPLTVIGILDDATREPALLSTIIVPRGTAERLWGSPAIEDAAHALIATNPGAALQIAQEAPLALRPDRVELIQAMPPPDPRTLRLAVDDDLASLFLALSAVCLLVGVIGIAGTTLVAVIERVPEIGLRRAVGARRRHVVIQVLTESGILAALGGVVGTTLGILTILAVALARGWTPVMEPLTLAAGPILGILTGLVAGAYPAYRAGRIPPAEALRR